MDKYTLQEEAYKNGKAAGLSEAFWHDVREEPFKPESEKDYVIKRILCANYATGEFIPRPAEVFRIDSRYKVPDDVMYWAQIPEVIKP